MFITVLCQKGEQAKSTTAVNLAAALAQSGKVGVIVDLDKQQCDATKFDGTIEEVTWATELPKKAPENGFVVVDTPPHIGPETMEALLKSDMVLIPCTPLSPSLEALARTFDTIDVARQKNTNLGAVVLFTRVEKKQYNEGMIAASRVFSRWPICETVIPSRPMDFERAYQARKPILCHLPKTNAAAAYRALGSEIQQLFNQP